MKYRFWLMLTGLLLPGVLPAQHFQYKSKLTPVAHTGFYRIRITPGIAAYCQPALEDLGLLDPSEKEIPYLIKRESTQQRETAFIPYPFTTSFTGHVQTLLVENREKKHLDKFVFLMKNANASRLVRISGSEDQKAWFVVRDSFYFESLADEEASVVKKTLTFPAGDYAFYKIDIATGHNESPLNILKVGDYNTSSQEVIYQPVEGLSFTRTDSNKTSYIHVRCQPANTIDRLTFSITAPEMYHRKLIVRKKVMLPDTYITGSAYKKSVPEQYYSNDYELSSDKATTIYCSDLLGSGKSDAFTLEISNLDDEPLHISSLKGYQRTTTITAKLEKGKTYFLYFGDNTLTAPAYDIVYFENNIPADPQTIVPMAIQLQDSKGKEEHHTSADKYMIWVGLGLTGIIILALTVNMMKKMRDQ